MNKTVPALLLGVVLCAGFATSQDPDLSTMFPFGKPTKFHKELASFIGKWDVTTTMKMPGMAPMASKGGQAEYYWLIDGRWLGGKLTAKMMGMPFEQFSITGFDNYRQNWVTTVVNSMDTSMNFASGVPVDPTGKVKAQYGYLDEPSMKQFKKPYKVVTRLESKDHIVMEVWDLGMGAAGAEVLRFDLTRQK